MNAEIIAVGSELLLGQIVNTNARFLSRQLADLGVNVFYHTVVGDNPKRLKTAIEIAENRSDFLIFTGGLGPTKDDLTKETIAKHLNKRLIMDEQALQLIELYFERSNRVMTENNKKQAIVLEGSQVLPNEHGMAPGMLLDTEKHMYMLLPGPPKEMEPMFLKYGYPILRSKLNEEDIILSRVLRFFGIGEAMLETEIEDLIDSQSNPTIAPLASDGEVSLRLTAKHNQMETVLQLLDEAEEAILARVGEYFYGYDDTSLMIETIKLLKENDLTISCAESLTGGMFQQTFTSIPGAGSLLKGGIVCYTNEVKASVLHVRKETIHEDGVVSAQCAMELAANVSALMNSDIGISFTGVAGPDELEGKPVGTVFIGIYLKGKPVHAEKLNLGGTREAIRVRSVKYGCYFLLKYLKSIQNVK
ncbi:competence/damage-inducible protein A [Bacillus sp. DTU_2020_1000418_1_SI_GHA_SEK_038]|uniref:competence/damage-inducible protein A n=1 Tax=Bacillus sp. DTU_2020_1000418_1_SI_GHA_SEK_038 TaxID=3077585 RepID=UPI0028F0EC59|nr:competence/damage-inducible protein A [Bacillus sp. DTU_2020_1000418_1_SI_GHA_SEK_038]WNS77245.1 competence/damage-inducible protein A [Bacillus sp. DTU_2020_1000418_1_SI_GHA_SEK_038]